MKLVTTIFLSLAMVSAAFGQDPVSHYQLPQPYNQEAPSDPELKNLVWNKWDTENFTILSLDAGQGKYLHDNIEQMKTWVLSRWGLPDVKFSAECRVLCVPNQQLMKKLFRLDQSHGEVRRNKDGKIELSVLWLVLDKKPAEVIPPSLTLVCLAELESRNLKMDYWTVRGMSLLNGTLPQIRSELAPLSGVIAADNKIFFSQKLFATTEEDWKKLSVEQRRLFDQESAALCLLLRKEFGQDNLLKFISTGGGEQNFASVYGFQSFQVFDSTLKSYMTNLAQDVAQNRTPNSYLQISPPSRK